MHDRHVDINNTHTLHAIICISMHKVIQKRHNIYIYYVRMYMHNGQ